MQGYTQLNKEHLLHALSRAFGIEEHHQRAVKGDIDKAQIKSRIKELKKQREAAIEAHDPAQLKSVRRQIHRLKRSIHKATA